MVLAGNEKKIQALFHEIKVADEMIAPGFPGVWNRVQARSTEPSRAFKITFAVATAVFVLTLCTFMLWLQNRQQPNPATAIISIAPDSTPIPVLAAPGPTQPGVVEAPVRTKPNHRDRRLRVRRQADINALNAASVTAGSISDWQSPTAMLMQSPADDVLTSLPQLDQSRTELKTFLPNKAQ
jgi:hypothetical protein